MTDKQMKVAIVYGENPKFTDPIDQYKFNAYAALWEEMKSVFINDEDLKPMIPQKDN